MGWLEGLLRNRGMVQDGRILRVDTGENVRELGGYKAKDGLTRYGRYVRSGDTGYLTDRDLRMLERYGITHVLDLRGSFERPKATCRFYRRAGIAWRNVPFFGFDISDPKLQRERNEDDFSDYLVQSYLEMLANKHAVRDIIGFLADVPTGQCALFHCAAGMDRTGVTAMLLLGSVGVSRAQILADYAYSFGSIAEVDRAVEDSAYDGESAWNSIQSRIRTMAAVYDTVIDAYGSINDFLLSCGVKAEQLKQLHDGFVDTSASQ